jgi:predicted N-acyltransferase
MKQKLSIRVNPQLAGIANDWDEMLPINHHLQSAHLIAFENANTADIQTFYVQVYLKEKFIGIVYLQKFSFQSKHLSFANKNGFAAKLVHFILPDKVPLLICGHLFRVNFQGFYFKEQKYYSYLFDALQAAIKDKSIDSPSGIIVKDCETVFAQPRCRQFGFRYFDGDVTMELHRRSNWNTFENYLDDFKKNYRQRAKKIRDALNGIIIKQYSAEEIQANSTEIQLLYQNVIEKQSVRLCTVNPNYFYELKKDLKHNFEFYALFIENKMIGFYTFIFYEKEMETHFIGLDYEANKQFQLYFNILFFGVEKMIERKYNTLELGRTAREAKANLGAVPKQILNYIHIKNRLIKLALNFFLNKFNDLEDTANLNRNPLK